MTATILPDIISRLMDLLTHTTEGHIVPPPGEQGPNSIRNTGVDSLGMLTFLVAVEDEFGIEWSDDLSQETLHSFEAMAHYIGKELGLAA